MNYEKWNKIDLFIDTVDGLHCPIQVKTRNIDSENFTLSPKDICPEQKNRVFAFIDKTFSPDVVEMMNDRMSLTIVKKLMLREEPHVFIESQEAIQDAIKKNEFETRTTSNGGTYYLIPKSFLEEVK